MAVVDDQLPELQGQHSCAVAVKTAGAITFVLFQQFPAAFGKA